MAEPRSAFYAIINAHLNKEVVTGNVIQGHPVLLRDVKTDGDAGILPELVKFANSACQKPIDWRHCRPHMDWIKNLDIYDPRGALLEVALQMGIIRRGASAQEHPLMSRTRLTQAGNMGRLPPQHGRSQNAPSQNGHKAHLVEYQQPHHDRRPSPTNNNLPMYSHPNNRNMQPTATRGLGNGVSSPLSAQAQPQQHDGPIRPQPQQRDGPIRPYDQFAEAVQRGHQEGPLRLYLPGNMSSPYTQPFNPRARTLAQQNAADFARQWNGHSNRPIPAHQQRHPQPVQGVVDHKSRNTVAVNPQMNRMMNVPGKAANPRLSSSSMMAIPSTAAGPQMNRPSMTTVPCTAANPLSRMMNVPSMAASPQMSGSSMMSVPSTTASPQMSRPSMTTVPRTAASHQMSRMMNVSSTAASPQMSRPSIMSVPSTTASHQMNRMMNVSSMAASPRLSSSSMMAIPSTAASPQMSRPNMTTVPGTAASPHVSRPSMTTVPSTAASHQMSRMMNASSTAASPQMSRPSIMSVPSTTASHQMNRMMNAPSTAASPRMNIPRTMGIPSTAYPQIGHTTASNGQVSNVQTNNIAKPAAPYAHPQAADWANYAEDFATFREQHPNGVKPKEKEKREKEHQEKMKADLKADLEKDRILGNDVLAYRYREYLKIYPLEPEERMSKYHIGLLANQIVKEGDVSCEARAVRHAKEKWWRYYSVKDKQMVMKQIMTPEEKSEQEKNDYPEKKEHQEQLDYHKKLGPRMAADMMAGGYLITAADIEAMTKPTVAPRVTYLTEAERNLLQGL